MEISEGENFKLKSEIIKLERSKRSWKDKMKLEIFIENGRTFFKSTEAQQKGPTSMGGLDRGLS